MDENVLVDPFDGVADLGRGPDGSDLRYLGVAHDDFALSNNMLLLMGWMRQRQIGSRHPLADLHRRKPCRQNTSPSKTVFVREKPLAQHGVDTPIAVDDLRDAEIHRR